MLGVAAQHEVAERYALLGHYANHVGIHVEGVLDGEVGEVVAVQVGGLETYVEILQVVAHLLGVGVEFYLHLLVLRGRNRHHMDLGIEYFRDLGGEGNLLAGVGGNVDGHHNLLDLAGHGAMTDGDHRAVGSRYYAERIAANEELLETRGPMRGAYYGRVLEGLGLVYNFAVNFPLLHHVGKVRAVLQLGGVLLHQLLEFLGGLPVLLIELNPSQLGGVFLHVNHLDFAIEFVGKHYSQA